MMTLGLTLLAIYLIAMVVFVYVKKDISIANFTWGGGVLLLSIYTLLAPGENSHREILMTALIVLWAGRMIAHLYYRYTGTDPRFRTWKTEGGLKTAIIDLLYVFGPQLLLLAIMSVPTVIINTAYQPPLNWVDFVGLGLWIVGFLFEAIADYQLYVFSKHPLNQGRIMQSGLWRYSRHPNYFGEVLIWWSIFIISTSAPGGLLTIVAPITITVLLLFVSGIPLAERPFKDNPMFQDYKRRTSAFIPWFVKK